MNDRWLTSFITVAQTGSITAAAKELFISPQALLQQLNLLEEEIGTPLLLRSRSGVKLTLAGREFLSGARQITDIKSRTFARCHLASKAERSIRIPMMSSIVLPKFMENVCSHYQKRRDALRIEFITDNNFGTRMEELKNLKYDIIEVFTLDGLCPDGIHFEYLSDVRSWCIVSDYHPLSSKTSIRPEDLDGCRLLMPADNVRLLRYLQIYIETLELNVTVDAIENDRYQYIAEINKGGVLLANEDIARIFSGYACAPLDFDTHVRHGFACREEMYELYKPFFDIAHQLSEPTWRRA